MIILEPFRRCFDFSSRARRKEFWIFALLFCVFDTLLFEFEIPLQTFIKPIYVFEIPAILLSLFIFIVSLSVSVRRLHDTDRSGWWLLVGFIPVVGWIWVIILFCLAGTEGDNRYGEDPKACLRQQIND